MVGFIWGMYTGIQDEPNNSDLMFVCVCVFIQWRLLFRPLSV